MWLVELPVAIRFAAPDNKLLLALAKRRNLFTEAEWWKVENACQLYDPCKILCLWPHLRSEMIPPYVACLSIQSEKKVSREQCSAAAFAFALLNAVHVGNSFHRRSLDGSAA